jgi:hypothetical protein
VPQAIPWRNAFPLFLHPSINGSFSENLFSQKEKNEFFSQIILQTS